MRDLDLKSLRLFLAVCEHQNIKWAGEQEHIEPSAISKRIAALEQALGARLLLRTRRGVQPTAVGQALLEHARSILFTMGRIEHDVSAFQGGMRGHVSLVASASAIAESLPDDVAGFLRQSAYRNINVDLEERLSVDVVRAVREGRAALGVCWDSADFSGLRHRPYREDELAVAVYPGHPLARRRSVRFKDTLAFDHVGLPPAAAVHALLRKAAAECGQSVRYRAVVSNFDAAFRVVSAGLAISVVPRQVGEDQARLRKVLVVPLSDAWAHRRFAIAYRSDDDLQPAAARLIDHLVRCAAQAASPA